MNKKWAAGFILFAFCTIWLFLRKNGMFGTLRFKPGTVIEFNSDLDDRAPNLVDLRTHRVVSISDLSAKSSSSGLVWVTWLRFLANGNLIVQYGDDIVEYDTMHRTKKVVFSLTSSDLPSVTWACAIPNMESVLYIDKQGCAWLKPSHSTRQIIAKDVFSGADCSDGEHVFMLHKDYTLFEHDIVTGLDRKLHTFNPGWSVSYDIRGRTVAILDRDRILLVSPDTTQIIMLGHTTTSIGGLTWIDDHNIAITEDKGEYTLFSSVNIDTHNIVSLFRRAGFIEEIHSAVLPPDVIDHLPIENRYRIF